MTHCAELLAFLTAKTQRFQVSPGGIPTLTPEDIAHALGLIKIPEAALYARVKYAGDPGLEKLALAIRRWALLRKANAAWRIPRKDFLLDIARLVVWEDIDPHTCTTCFGRAEVRPKSGPVILCNACRGTGRQQIRDCDRARLVGLSRSSWSDPWADRCREIQIGTVDLWKSIFLSSVGKRLRA